MNDLTAFQRDILYAIAGQDEPHGLAIKQTLDNYYDEDINHGRLYPNLDDLVDVGFVEKGEKDRRTNSYHLTDDGIDAIESRKEFIDSNTEELGESSNPRRVTGNN